MKLKTLNFMPINLGISKIMITDSHYFPPKPFLQSYVLSTAKKFFLHDSGFMVFIYLYIFYLESYWLSDFKILVVKYFS